MPVALGVDEGKTVSITNVQESTSSDASNQETDVSKTFEMQVAEAVAHSESAADPTVRLLALCPLYKLKSVSHSLWKAPPLLMAAC